MKFKVSTLLMGFKPSDLFVGGAVLTLDAFAVAVLFSILLVAVSAVNVNGDSYFYHLPFAARLFNIIPANVLGFQPPLQNRYDGFPLLTEWLQGLFWFITGRPQAAALVCYLSLITFLIYLKVELRIPVYMSAFSLLAVPMVHMHATSGYDDLPGNIALAALFLSVFLCYVNRSAFASQRRVGFIFVSAALAANTKFQAVPGVCVGLTLFGLRAILDVWKTKEFAERKRLLTWVCAGALSVPLVFATEARNLAVYGNPFYPVEWNVAGIGFKGPEAPSTWMAPVLKELPPHFRWGKSLLEIHAFDNRRPYKWTLGMDYIAMDDPKFGIGGYFAPYVIFNLVLFGFLSWRRRHSEGKYAFGLMSLLTLFTPLLPQAYELRYYMYWMIVLVALNCRGICLIASGSTWPSYLTKIAYALICASFMIVFIHETHDYYTQPQAGMLNAFLHNDKRFLSHAYSTLDEEAIRHFQDGDKICLVGYAGSWMFYTPYFQSDKNYYIKGQFVAPEDELKKLCGDLKIIHVP